MFPDRAFVCLIRVSFMMLAPCYCSLCFFVCLFVFQEPDDESLVDDLSGSAVPSSGQRHECFQADTDTFCSPFDSVAVRHCSLIVFASSF